MSLVDVNGQSLSFLCERLGIREEAVLRELMNGTLVGPAVINRRERSFSAKFHLPSRLPFAVYSQVMEAFRAFFGELARQVNVQFEYGSAEQDVLARVQDYWVYAVNQVLGDDHSLKGELKDPSRLVLDERQLRVPVTSDVIVNRCKQKGYDEKLAIWLKEFLDMPLIVQLYTDQTKQQEEFENFRSLVEEQDRLEGQKAAVAVEEEKRQEAAKAESGGKNGNPPPDKVELGHPIEEPATRLKLVQDEMRRVVVEGRIFTVETRELASGRTLFTFNITDNSDSISCKTFAKGDKQVEVLKLLKDGMFLRVRGTVQFDTFAKELVLMIQDLVEIPKPVRRDNAEKKRVELHLHTPMSPLDGVGPVKDLYSMAAKWGHTAIAVTDHGVVQSFPEAYSVAKKNNMKCLLGVEAYVVDDGVSIVYQLEDDIVIDDNTTWIVFDTETTGLNAAENTLIEIAAVKMKGMEIVEEWTELIDPEVPISAKITELTHITNDMVRGKRKLHEVLPDFRAFVGDGILVAHNAEFDLGFLKASTNRTGTEAFTNVVLDTLPLARRLYPREKNYRLGTLAKKFEVDLVNAHRALDDTVALARIYQYMLKEMKEQGFDTLKKLNENNEVDYTRVRPFHATILVQNKVGLKNLYRLVSESHLKYFHRVPRVPRSLIAKYREGLLIGTACQQGEVFDGILRGKTKDELKDIAAFYDYLEIQPPLHYKPLLRNESIASLESVKDYHRMIIEVGHELDKPVVATGDVHYVNPEDAIYRDVFLQSQNDPNAGDQPPLYLMSTDEMLEHFAYLGPQLAEEVVVTNTNKIADLIEDVSPVPDQLYTPKIEGAEDEMREMCYDKARRMYGNELPEIVEKRLEKELNSIIK
ncbi:MAG: exonuclease domain-containing protein, partial [Tumebacillaceae bacterium]